MTALVLSVMLAFAWMALTGRVSAEDFVVALAIAAFVVFVVRRAVGSDAVSAFARLPKMAAFAGFFLWELLLANLRVLVSVIMPLDRLRPAVIAVPLDVQSRMGITLLVMLVTLTPGTLALDVSDDCHCMYIHTIHVDDEEALRRQIKEGFERRILEVLG